MDNCAQWERERKKQKRRACLVKFPLNFLNKVHKGIIIFIWIDNSYWVGDGAIVVQSVAITFVLNVLCNFFLPSFLPYFFLIFFLLTCVFFCGFCRKVSAAWLRMQWWRCNLARCFPSAPEPVHFWAECVSPPSKLIWIIEGWREWSPANPS